MAGSLKVSTIDDGGLATVFPSPGDVDTRALCAQAACGVPITVNSTTASSATIQSLRCPSTVSSLMSRAWVRIRAAR